MASEKTFEENLAELETIVSKLEKGDVPLEQALSEFQKGIELSTKLNDTLKNAETTLAKVMQDSGQEVNFDIRDTENE